MKGSMVRIMFLLLPAIVVAAGIVGCAQIRELTYPKDFTYLEDKEVESLMHRMGESIGTLDRLVATASPEDDDRQREIIAELTKLEAIATRLSGDHTQTNQFVINDHIGGFLSDIGTAKMFASAKPPKYYKISYVTNGCNTCHNFR